MNENDIETVNDELYEHYSFEASTGQEPLRVDKFLMRPSRSARYCHRARRGRSTL